MEMSRKAVQQARLQNEDAAAAIAQKQRRADKVRHSTSVLSNSWAQYQATTTATSNVHAHWPPYSVGTGLVLSDCWRQREQPMRERPL